jgi:RNA polymerase sigma-70 factor (ECF subfamily)
LWPARNEKPDINRLIDSYSKNLMRLCYIYLKDYHLAEDAVQETLTKAYMKYGTFKNQSSEKTWVTRIAMNVCRNYLRKPSNREFSSNEYISLSYASDDKAAADFRNEDSIMLLNAVYSLPEIYKQSILLYYYQDLKTAEIAEILNEKEGTISVRLKRAKDMLREMLKEE